jgi:hypothetical protein
LKIEVITPVVQKISTTNTIMLNGTGISRMPWISWFMLLMVNLLPRQLFGSICRLLAFVLEPILTRLITIRGRPEKLGPKYREGATS